MNIIIIIIILISYGILIYTYLSLKNTNDTVENDFNTIKNNINVIEPTMEPVQQNDSDYQEYLGQIEASMNNPRIEIDPTLFASYDEVMDEIQESVENHDFTNNIVSSPFNPTKTHFLGYEISLDANNFNITNDFVTNGHKEVNGDSQLKGSFKVNAFKNMIAPFYVNFTDAGDIIELRNKGWWLCDGSNIKYTRSDTNETNSVTLPNLIGRFVFGGNIDTSLFKNTGGEAHTNLDLQKIPNHKHDVRMNPAGAHRHKLYVHNTCSPLAPNFGSGDHRHTQARGADCTNSNPRFTLPDRMTTRGSHTHPITQNNKGNNRSHNNLPPYMSLAYFIYLPETITTSEPGSYAHEYNILTITPGTMYWYLFGEGSLGVDNTCKNDFSDVCSIVSNNFLNNFGQFNMARNRYDGPILGNYNFHESVKNVCRDNPRCTSRNEPGYNPCNHCQNRFAIGRDQVLCKRSIEKVCNI